MTVYRYRFAACLAALCLLAPVIGAGAMGRENDGDPVLVSRASGAAGPGGNASSTHAAISRTGRFVAFESMATNLVPDDTDAASDILVRDLDTDELTLVSRASGDGPKGDGHSTDPSLSANGRVIAFTSTSDTLVPGVDGGSVPGGIRTHVFARDLSTGTTVVVDQASEPGGAVGDCGAKAPSISADGRFVAFTSCATNLDPAATNGTLQVYLRDLLTSTTTLVSRTAGAGGRVASDESGDPYVSGDGSRVAFSSNARNLVPEGRINPRKGAAFVRDLSTDKTILISRRSGPDGERSGGLNGAVGISADGQSALFYTSGENLDPKDDGYAGDIFLRNLETNETVPVTGGVRDWGRFSPGQVYDGSISASGRFVAFAVAYSARRGYRERAAIYDVKKGRTMPVKQAVTGGNPALRPDLSSNSKWLAYSSPWGSDGIEGDRTPDVFAVALDGLR